MKGAALLAIHITGCAIGVLVAYAWRVNELPAVFGGFGVMIYLAAAAAGIEGE